MAENEDGTALETTTAAASPPQKKRPRRQIRLTRELTEELCKVLRATSTPVKDTVLAAGIPEKTFYRWLEKGARAKAGIYWEFGQSISEARAQGTRAAVALLRKLSVEQKDWRGIAWELERTRPKEFSPRLKLHVQSEMEEAINRLKKGFEDDPVGLEKVLRLLVGEFGGGGASEDPISQGGEDVGGGEAVHSPPAEPAPEGVPKPGAG